MGERYDNYDYYRGNQAYIESVGIITDEVLNQHPTIMACRHEAHSSVTTVIQSPDNDRLRLAFGDSYGRQPSEQEFQVGRQAMIDSTLATARHYMINAYPDITNYFSGRTPQEQPAGWKMATAFSRADWQSGCLVGDDETLVLTKTSFHGAVLYATAERFDITRHYGDPDKQQRFILTWIDDLFIRAEVFQQSDGQYAASGSQPDTVSLTELEAVLKTLQR